MEIDHEGFGAGGGSILGQPLVRPEQMEGDLMTTKYDAIVIGTGQSGPSLATRLAGVGMKVAIIERKLFGGTCVNTG